MRASGAYGGCEVAPRRSQSAKPAFARLWLKRADAPPGSRKPVLNYEFVQTGRGKIPPLRIHPCGRSLLFTT